MHGVPAVVPGGTGARDPRILGTITAIYLTGYIADRGSFAPVLVGASIIPLIAMVAMLTLVRNTAATRAGLVREV